MMLTVMPSPRDQGQEHRDRNGQDGTIGEGCAKENRMTSETMIISIR